MLCDPKIEKSWKKVLSDEFQKPYFQELKTFLVREREAKKMIYPPPKDIFHAFEVCPFSSVRVVILGQDPYHGAGQAHGLCFSVRHGTQTPPSLQNIYKELKNEFSNFVIPNHGNLEKWAKQGVLLLNAVLTVREGFPTSHAKKGWEHFSDAVIQKLSDEKEGLIFLLWGKYAQKKGKRIDRKKHTVLTAAHPSPLSAYNGFFGCEHFAQTNAILHQKGEKEIDWQV